MFLLLLIAPKQKNFCVTKDRVPLRGSAVRLAPALLLSKPPGCGALLLLRASPRPRKRQTAAPAPLRLFLPLAAPQLRSPPPICRPFNVSPGLRARPRGGSKRKTAPSAENNSKRGRFLGLPYHKVSLYLRACTWLPRLRGSWHRVRKRPVTERAKSWREAPERGANKNRPRPYFADEGAVLLCAIFLAVSLRSCGRSSPSR